MKLIYLVVLSISVFCNSTFAECQFAKNIEIEKIKNSPFCWNESSKGWISKNCSEKTQCLALNEIKKSKNLKKLAKKINLDGGKNLGTSLCKELSGIVLYSFSKIDESESTFCQFSDQSLIDTQSLQYVVLKK